MDNKKGQNLSVNTIIITILAIFVLVILVVALTGGTGQFADWWNKVWGSSAIDTQGAVLQCNGYCQAYEVSGDENFRDRYCHASFEVDLDNDRKADVTLYCTEMPAAACSAIQC
ncbi:hypothetical protein K8R33_03740 [archaeon]|nr:hypothetical protein [archaeon]